jgi:hypothetical protein
MRRDGEAGNSRKFRGHNSIPPPASPSWRRSRHESIISCALFTILRRSRHLPPLPPRLRLRCPKFVRACFLGSDRKRPPRRHPNLSGWSLRRTQSLPLPGFSVGGARRRLSPESAAAPRGRAPGIRPCPPISPCSFTRRHLCRPCLPANTSSGRASIFASWPRAESPPTTPFASKSSPKPARPWAFTPPAASPSPSSPPPGPLAPSHATTSCLCAFVVNSLLL